MKLCDLKNRDLLSKGGAAAARELMSETGYDIKESQQIYLNLLKDTYPGFKFSGCNRPVGTPYLVPYKKMCAFKIGAKRTAKKMSMNYG